MNTPGNVAPETVSSTDWLGRLWNGWSGNYSRREDGYITHAWEEGVSTGRALCGVWIHEGGGLNLRDDNWEPGCLRCRRILIKRGWRPNDQAEVRRDSNRRSQPETKQQEKL